ncbi:MAG: chemotaxis response regulator protein-glutamate methylesterase [Oscillospiraceae bacterium]|nr:chemotaxis response regulator protein-glutamate methylesterase [Oscillospiraceae bacterium]
MPKKVRIVIVDDSLVFRTFLQHALEPCHDIEIAGVFADPVEALDRISKISPDVLVIDMEMPKIRGNEFLKKAMPNNPHMKAVIISSLSDNVFDAMQAGATDFVSKPASRPGYTNTEFTADIIETIRIAATAKPRAAARYIPQTKPAAPQPVAGLRPGTGRSLIAIGASTGGTEAILQVIQTFPADTPGVVIVQHMPPGFTKMYADRADKICSMTVREAKNNDRVERGLILIAPGGSEQMRVESSDGGYTVDLRHGPKVSGHCPSVDVLFDSVASAAGRNAVGVILTGMGADGAQGLKKMRMSGAHTIGQDENTCIVYGMPKVAYDIGGVAEQLPLQSIGHAVTRRLSK